MSTIMQQFEFHPTDSFQIDGQPFVYLGHSDRGYLFCQSDGAMIEVPASEMIDLVIEPGRFSMEPEYFKKGARK